MKSLDKATQDRLAKAAREVNLRSAAIDCTNSAERAVNPIQLTPQTEPLHGA